jgi:hypothetical protein
MGQPSQKRLLAPCGMMEAFHHEQLSVDGVVGLIEQGAGHRHLGIFKHRIPACFLVLKPLAHTGAVSFPCYVGDMVGKVA